MHKIRFERVKKIVLENIQAVERHITNMPKLMVWMVRLYIGDGMITRTRWRAGGWGPSGKIPTVEGFLRDTIVKYVNGVDIRCLGELLELIPQGIDPRLPAWLYRKVDAVLDDDGWALVPAE